MKLVFDSNIFCSDFWLQKSSFHILFENLERVNITLCIPQLVLDESVNKYNEMAQAELSKINKSELSLRKTLGIEIDITNSSECVNEATNKYRTWLLNKLKSGKAILLPYPTISHEYLAKRAINKIRPFADNGNGYRDALIWENILHLLKEQDDDIAFVSMNIKDFADLGNKSSLHPDLLRDIQPVISKNNQVSLYTRIEDFVDMFISPRLKKLDGILIQIVNEAYPILDLDQWVYDHLFESSNKIIFLSFEDFYTEDREVDLFIVDKLDNFSKVNALDVREVNSKEIAIHAEVKADCIFRLFSHTIYEPYDVHSKYKWFKDDSLAHMSALDYQPVLIRFLVIFDVYAKQITSGQIKHFEPFRRK